MKSERVEMLIASITFIACILLYNIFSIFIEYYIGTFEVMVLFFIVMFLLGMIAFSLIKIYIDKQSRFYIFILASIISLYLLSTQTFRFIGLDMDFNISKNERLKVVNMLRGGTIEFNTADEYIKLPTKYSYLSRYDGQIMVDSEEDSFKTCFFTSGGLFKKHDIVIYISNNDNLADGDFGEEISNIKKLEDHWFSGQITR